MSQAHLRILGLTCTYGAREVLQNLSFRVEPGQLVGVIGPNGSGKTTLLKTLSRILPPKSGEVWLDQEDLLQMKQKTLAQRLAVVSQEENTEFSFRVWEVVMMGRYPHQKMLRGESDTDREKVRWALQVTDLLSLADRFIDQLSGGERQRVMIARALAQEPELLLLDEPTSHLDLGHQMEVLDLIQELRQKTVLTVIMAVHDINLASQYCDQLVLLKDGQIYDIGTPAKVVTAQHIQEAYGSPALINLHPLTHRPQVLLYPGKRPAPQATAAGRVTGRLHIIGGGGSACQLLDILSGSGISVTLGVVNIFDSDWEKARAFGVQMIEAPPFTQIDEALHQANLELLGQAQAVILANVPFGWGNLLNLQAAESAVEDGKPIVVINSDLKDRDFTGGQAAKIFARLLQKGALVVHDSTEAFECLIRLLRDTSPKEEKI